LRFFFLDWRLKSAAGDFFVQFFEISSDELGTGNTRHLRKSIVNNLLILLRYTVIIYKFTRGNLGAKKIASSLFQSPVKKKKSQIATKFSKIRRKIFVTIHSSSSLAD
jgi:hypothetical protein